MTRAATAVTIASLPFSTSADLRSAHPDDDQGQCFGSDWPVVWYRYTPNADAILALEVSGEARAAFFFDGEEGDTVAGCTGQHGPVERQGRGRRRHDL